MKSVFSSIVFALTVLNVSAFAPQQKGLCRTSVVTYGLFDFFSEEARAKREAENKRLKDEQEQAQREILERRLNPDKEAEYFSKVVERRKQFDELDDGRKTQVIGEDD